MSQGLPGLPAETGPLHEHGPGESRVARENALTRALTAFWGSNALARRYGRRLVLTLGPWGIAAGVGAGVLAGLIQAGSIVPLVDYPALAVDASTDSATNVDSTGAGTVGAGPAGAAAVSSDAAAGGGAPSRASRDFFAPATLAVPAASAMPAARPVARPAPARRADSAGAVAKSGAAGKAAGDTRVGSGASPATDGDTARKQTGAATVGLPAQAPVQQPPETVPPAKAAVASAPQPPVESGPPPFPKNISVKGIAVMGARRAAILATGPTSDAYVAGDDVADGWKVDNISATAVTFVKDGHSVVLEWKGD